MMLVGQLCIRHRLTKQHHTNRRELFILASNVLLFDAFKAVFVVLASGVHTMYT